ncbi:hypothetical protein CCAX7_000350 [Capsulimonas corticalis]|uniref:Uncharacterized protein n=1 Tax=Capsulimonas corticalis TaxID=2219043 RepID=A0A402CR50_9BACT|nr:hypothetical protein [Capsulimonas corticalis]BDI27984.1 hypothetical protein CCAX7_000350 [Capsulimonas corticalis]
MMSFLRLRCGYSREEVGRTTLPEVFALFEDIPYIDPRYTGEKPKPKRPRTPEEAAIAHSGGIRM